MTASFRKVYIATVFEQLKDWVGADAPRSVAAAALDAWRLNGGIDEETRQAVLWHFEADADPVPNVDYLPEIGIQRTAVIVP